MSPGSSLATLDPVWLVGEPHGIPSYVLYVVLNEESSGLSKPS